MTPLVPLEGGFGPHGPAENSLSALPFFGGFLLLVVLLAALGVLYLWHQGKLTLPILGTSRSPEDEAKRILAGRFARGDISSEEFLERSSFLNWTPGIDPMPSRLGRKRRRLLSD